MSESHNDDDRHDLDVEPSPHGGSCDYAPPEKRGREVTISARGRKDEEDVPEAGGSHVHDVAKSRSSAAQTQDVSLWARILRKKGRFQSENVQDVDQPGVV